MASFAAQLTGRAAAAGARRHAWYGLLLALATELACAAAVPALGRAVALVDTSPEVRTLLVSYLSLRLLSGGAVVGLEALGNYYSGIGNTRLPMLAQLLVMALNLGLDWVLIFGHLGAPALGVAGAALASTLATFGGLALLLSVFAAQRFAGELRLKLAQLRRLLRFGVPAGIDWFVEAQPSPSS